MDDSLEFWFEYVTAAREFYLTGRPVDANADPMLAAMVEWLKKIEIAMQKAASEGCQYFSCDLVERRRRIALRFKGADGRGFERTVRIDERFKRYRTDERRRYAAPLTDTEIIDLQICIQSLIAGAPHRLSRLPPGSNKFILLGAIAFPSPERL
jgi:hypothetical protein